MRFLDDSIFYGWWHSEAISKRRSQCAFIYWDVENVSLDMYLSACEFLQREFSAAYKDGDSNVFGFESMSNAFEIVRDAPSKIIDSEDEEAFEIIKNYLEKVRREINRGIGTERFTPLDNAYFFNTVFYHTVATPLKKWLMVANIPAYDRALSNISKIIDRNGGEIEKPYINNELYEIGDNLLFDWHEIQNNDEVFSNGDLLSHLLFISKAVERDYMARFESSRAGAAHAGEIAKAATVAQPQHGAAAGGSCAAAGHVGAADDLLNENAAQFVTDYKPAVSFHFRCADVEGVTVNIQAFSIGNIRPARLLLEKERYKDGWCYVENWTRPSPKKCRDEERIFFSHIESKTDSGVGAVGDKYYFRIAPKVAKRAHGGARAGAGRKGKTK